MATVTVASKLPFNLRAVLGDKALELNGFNSDFTIAGFGITENVDEEFFNAHWHFQRSDSITNC